MKQYLSLVEHVLRNGEKRTDRTGTGTISVFGTQSRYNLRDGFPLVTTKKVLFDAVVRELLWMLSGSTNIHDNLTQHTPIWDAWADEEGYLGPVYGFQWRNWYHYKNYHIDQIKNALDMIKNTPDSRRIIVSAWNVAEIEEMSLPPCHMMFQFYVRDDYLDLHMYQRSADIALGVPFNIASYALLLKMFAMECNLFPGEFIHTIGDAHIYLNHVDGLKKQLDRKPYPLPRVFLKNKSVLVMKFEDITLCNYKHHPFIKFDVSV